ncbi:MAG: YqiA/YcfP family alpha/beta fold hydrolase [Bacteroidota bacterium]
MPTDPLTILKKRGRSTDFVLIIHGYEGSPETMQYVQGLVEAHLPDADIYTPELPHSHRFSSVRAIKIVQDLLDVIDLCYEEYAYERILIIGSSIGGLLARKIYIHACGENEEAPFEPAVKTSAPKVWAPKVDRIILLAGMNRGWAITHHLSYKTAFLFTAGLCLGKLLELIGIQPTMFEIRRGAPFITELRVQWMYMRYKSKVKSVGNATTIQLLGSIDDLVAPEDNIDLVSGADFIYLDVPHSNHTSVLLMDESEEGKARAAVFEKALMESPEILDTLQEIPADASELIQPRPEVTDVVFVIHGIRDEGYWTHKIARRIVARARQKAPHRVIASETSSYGYFPIIDFLLLGQREKKVHWLMDQYVEALAMYPNAEFSYVGHSNGTYLLAKALKDYQCCRFKHVVFASSVVRTDYDWETPINTGKVKAVLSFAATNDFVVAWAPYFFETFDILDLGGAGHIGFRSKAIHQIKYVEGGHSAAREEDNWNSIADFIINGPPAIPTQEIIREKQPSGFKGLTLLGRFGCFIFLFAAFLSVLGYLLWMVVQGSFLPYFFIIFYGILVLWFLKKF